MDIYPVIGLHCVGLAVLISLIIDQSECFVCYLFFTCLKTAFLLANGEWIRLCYQEGKIAFLPVLRKLRLCAVFEQALVEIILLAYGGLYFTMNLMLVSYYDTYDRFKFSLSTADTPSASLLLAIQNSHHPKYSMAVKTIVRPSWYTQGV